jgi:hypothetical protein
MKLYEVDAEQIKLPPKVVAAFEKLGNDQRGLPERAMLKAQHLMGGGVMSHAIEHVGDLTHRMSHMMGWNTPNNDGREYIVDKCTKILRSLQNEYGFEREFMGNIKNNGSYYAEKKGITDPAEVRKFTTEFFEEVKQALNTYAKEHSKLTVYNHAQWLARAAAVMLGMRKFSAAEQHLTDLLSIAQNEQKYAIASREYELDKSGNPIPYKP